ncbi:MAG: sulfatase-like hydrolase/transferase [Candidatus Lambdaproteobacteria bacterium]|nr:sulfatase-like hydrolase/transferase [Candidatus Lambdaproteobacteria bacterium]
MNRFWNRLSGRWQFWVLYGLILLPALVYHFFTYQLTPLRNAHALPSASALVSGPLFDLTWGTVFFLLLLPVQRVSLWAFRVLAAAYAVGIYTWAYTNALFTETFFGLLSFEDLLIWSGQHEVGAEYAVGNATRPLMLAMFVLPALVSAALLLWAPRVRLRLPHYGMLLLAALIAHTYANTYAYRHLSDPRAFSVFNYAYASKDLYDKKERFIGSYYPPAAELRLVRANLGFGDGPVPEPYPFYREHRPTALPLLAPFRGNNVILVILESVSDACLDDETTPNLNAMKRKAIYFPNYYITGQYTSVSTFDILFSTVGAFVKSQYGPAYLETYPSLNEVLQANGYTIEFYKGGPLVQKLRDFFRNNGDMRMFDSEQVVNELQPDYRFNPAPGANDIIDDRLIFAFARKYIEVIRRPFMAVVATVSTHGPYFFPNDYQRRLPDEAQEAHRFGDEEFGKFLAWFEANPAFKDTMLVVTSDTATGCRYRLAQMTSPHKINDYLLHAPLFFYRQGMRQGHVIATPGSHVDLAPTILDALGYGYRSSFLGMSLFRSDVPRRQVYFRRYQRAGYVQDGCFYYYKNDLQREHTCRDGTNVADAELVQKFHDIDAFFNVINFIENNKGVWVDVKTGKPGAATAATSPSSAGAASP